MLVRDQIRSLRLALDKLDRQILLLNTQLANSLDKTTWVCWDRCSWGRVDTISKKLKNKHNSKLSKLEQQDSSSIDNYHSLLELEQ